MGKLLAQSTAGLLFLLLMLGLALMLPAGTLRYWQAWTYLAVFAGCTILITVDLIRHDRILLASRIQAGPAAEAERSQRVIQSLASLFFLGLFVVSGLDHRHGWSTLPGFVSLLADALVALGFFLVWRVFRENRFSRATIEVSPDQQVIATGPYRVVRHPMYSGALLLLLATPPAVGSWAGLLCWPPLLLVIVARLLDEERVLQKQLAGYAGYCRQVRHRLIPGLW